MTLIQIFFWGSGGIDFPLYNSGIFMLLTGGRGCLLAISIPILGRLSFPRMFLSCPEVIKNGVSSANRPLDCNLTTTFPMMLIVSLENPPYSSLVFFSTGCFSIVGFSTSIRVERFASLGLQMECSD